MRVDAESGQRLQLESFEEICQKRVSMKVTQTDLVFLLPFLALQTTCWMIFLPAFSSWLPKFLWKPEFLYLSKIWFYQVAVFLTCKCIHHWVQILWRDSVSVVDMEGGRTYLSTFCASGVHAYSGPMALEARVLLQGGRSGGMAGNSITARKTECRRSASYLWNGRCLASPTLA